MAQGGRGLWELGREAKEREASQARQLGIPLHQEAVWNCSRLMSWHVHAQVCFLRTYCSPQIRTFPSLPHPSIPPRYPLGPCRSWRHHVWQGTVMRTCRLSLPPLPAFPPPPHTPPYPPPAPPQLGPTLPRLLRPSWPDFKTGALRGGLPQLPLTTLNSVIAVTQLANALFGDK